MAFTCTCTDCVTACRRKPGWFIPGKAEKTAGSLDMTLQEFFDKHLAVDWWDGNSATNGEDIYVLAPVLVGEEEGGMYPGDPEGVCSLLDDEGRCTVHEHGKPFECAQLTHDGHADHFQVALAWVPYQNQIRELLGHEPETSEYNGFGFNSIFDRF